MATLPEYRDTALPCFDPDCVDAAGRRSVAEPEQDGEHRYHACVECGYAFGFQRIVPVDVAVTPDGCAVGIPEAVRRRASAAMEGALAQQARHEPPLMTIGRRPDATAS